MKYFFNKFLVKIKFQEIALVILSIYFPLFFFNLGLYFTKDVRNNDREVKVKAKMLKARNNGFVPYYYPRDTFNLIDGFYPLGGKQNSNTYFCDEGYGLIKYKSDRFGLRNKDKNWDSFKFPKRKTFFVGDSFVHGACVDNKYTISERFQNLSGDLTYNLGASGASPAHYEAVIKMLLEPMYKSEDRSKKDNVVLIFYFNDNCKSCEPNLIPYEKAKKIYHPIIPNSVGLTVNPKYSENIEKLVEKSEVKLKVQNEKLNKLSFNFLRNFFALTEIKKIIRNYTYHFGLLSKYNKNDATQKSIVALQELCIDRCKPFTAYIPPQSKGIVLGSERYKNHIKNVSKKNKVSYVPLENVIRSNNFLDYAPKGGHLSIEGYKKVAEYIHKHINFN
tara:strand:+ start:483 stop:1652 length:1170 start_codon:yes stop_codon:yes gene_type:complete